ncbi:MAG: hypothetical protein ACNA8G_11855 [Gammaproteobacteria bacterium]
MSLNDTVMMAADDFEECAQLARRIEFLKLKSSPMWKYRRAEICATYADVCDTRFGKLTETQSEL